MAFDFDSFLGVHPHAVKMRSQRMKAIASNLANADTPNYLARDYDFREMLANAESESGRVRRTHDRHLAAVGVGIGHAALKYRVPLQPTLDGNTVETQFEQSAFADNAIRYQASLRFLSGRLRGLSEAITGGMR